jgi:hypothetical protein
MLPHSLRAVRFDFVRLVGGSSVGFGLTASSVNIGQCVRLWCLCVMEL